MKFSSYQTENLEFEARKAVLGEGLCLAPSFIAWVDIENRTVFWNEQQYDLRDCVPSVIFMEIDGALLLGTDLGIQILHKSGRLEMAVKLEGHDPDEFRLNDGCALGNQGFLVGAMSKKEPAKIPGAIYRFDLSGRSDKLDWDCHIPNGFVDLGNSSILICDSSKCEIYKVNLSNDKHMIDVWYTGSGPETPDGGCLLPDGHIAFAMWDGAKIQVFDIYGKPTRSIEVPAKRPTNCKFCIIRKRLLVTTASFGLDTAVLRQYPLSGNLLSLKIQ